MKQMTVAEMREWLDVNAQKAKRLLNDGVPTDVRFEHPIPDRVMFLMQYGQALNFYLDYMRSLGTPDSSPEIERSLIVSAMRAADDMVARNPDDNILGNFYPMSHYEEMAFDEIRWLKAPDFPDLSSPDMGAVLNTMMQTLSWMVRTAFTDTVGVSSRLAHLTRISIALETIMACKAGDDTTAEDAVMCAAMYAEVLSATARICSDPRIKGLRPPEIITAIMINEIRRLPDAPRSAELDAFIQKNIHLRPGALN